MHLYSYVVARDFGFAPNPFGIACTLCTCKPNIRRVAQIGDWIVGTGSAVRQRTGYLVYAMVVSETMTFQQYWDDLRFADKKPDLRGSTKRRFGDNIYSRQLEAEQWIQLDSHHSMVDGRPNEANIANDTQSDRILVSTDFVYFGGSGPIIPARFRDFAGTDICAVRNHKSSFPPGLVDGFAAWVRKLGKTGYCGRPLDWT